MRSIHDELLHALCERIKKDAIDVLTESGKNPHEQYLNLYQHVKESDRIISDCFDQWSRSRLQMKILFLRRQGLLSDAHVEYLSDSAREWLAVAEKLKEPWP